MMWDNPAADLTAPSGRFAGAIPVLSTAMWDGGLNRRLRRKAWVFAGVMDKRFSIGFAVVDAGLLATAFVYVFDREREVLIERKLTRLFGFAAGFTPTPMQCWQLHQGTESYQWSYDAERARYVAVYTDMGAVDGLDVRIALAKNSQEISALNRLPDRPMQYTQKNIGMVADVTLSWQGTSYTLKSQHGVFDFSLGYPPRQAHWQWGCLSGATADGQPVGINLVAQYFNGLENTLWFGGASGQRMPLAQAVFDYTMDDVLQPWHLRTVDGAVDIYFEPQGVRKESINLGLLSSRFQQPFGRFEGICRPDKATGKEWISGFGVVEHHSALW